MKLQRVEFQQGYVLHARPYRETSLLLECFISDYGRISLVAKGVRQSKSKMRGLLQPFVPLLISWVGKSELGTLTQVEHNGASHLLRNNQLLCAFYANELLLRLLHRDDPHPVLFTAYQDLLSNLALPITEEVSLRVFEKRLLQELGYAFSLTEDCRTTEPIRTEHYYDFEPLLGLSKVSSEVSSAISGASILALAKEELDQSHLGDAKRLMRKALGTLIGDKPLKSRELFF